MLVHNVQQSVGDAPLNTSCTLTETLPPAPAGACPSPKVATWEQMQVAPSNPFQITGPTLTVTVTNTLDCKDGGDGDTGYLRVTKTIDRGDVNLPLSQLTSMVFPMTATCGSNTYPLNVSMLSPGIITGIPANATCTVSETLPPPPVNGCSPRQTPVWVNSPSYNPASVTIVPGQGPVINVKNTLQCQPIGNGGSDGSIDVTKTVNNLTNGLVSTAGLTYPVTVTCGGNTTSLTLSEGVAQTVQPINTGTTCTVAEGPIVTPSGCPTDYLPSWSTTITPASVPVNGPHTPVSIVNTLTCKLIPSGKGWLSVTKVINNPDNVPIAGLTFPATANCGGTVTPLVLSTLGPQIVNNLTIGTTCTVTETLPPPPTTGCIGGPSPHWVNSPSYSPASANATGGSPATITVTNTITCASQTPPPPPPPPTACKPPLVPGPVPGQCVCPAGKRKRGKTCVEQVVCHPPAHLNSKGTACICPRGMIRKGNTCVEREQPRHKPSATKDDVLRVVPGIIGGSGIFRGGHGGGGAR